MYALNNCCWLRCVDCGNLAYLDHGRVDSSAGTLYAAVASFTCNTGYVRSGTASVTCTSAGTWSDAVPTCTIRSEHFFFN
ncbi:hypothetical protein DPMN_051749 [Dreissena polymorpha]|uniref:Sushi domain-containing protein n=1 Tax=Dreissena polymorpha TaxID=45954 RepID=A0A9D4CJJ3_DREPO|nr:hypothetical protein DPMN_051749 [Dreissena polymorpha]